MLAKISGGNGVVQMGSDSTLIPLGGRRVWMLVPPPPPDTVQFLNIYSQVDCYIMYIIKI